MRSVSLVLAALAVAVIGCGDDVTDPGGPNGIALVVGQVRTIDAAAAAPLLLAGEAGSEFTLIALNTTDVSSPPISVQFLGEQLSPPIGPPTPRMNVPASSPSPARYGSEPGSAVLDFQARLNQLDNRSLTTRIAAARAAFPGGHRLGAALSGVPEAGAQVALNTSTASACATQDMHTGRVVAVKDHAVIVADESNPDGGFTDAEYAEIAEDFDAFVFPVLSENFGAPSDIDANGERIVIFFTRAVNELSPPGSSSFINGFFFLRDLAPRSGPGSCSGSNEAELLYAMAPDPNGEVNGNVRTKELVQGRSLGNLAHLTQYLVNTSRRMFVSHAPALEENWLNAGLSQIAQELVFYRAAGMAPRQNITDQTFFGALTPARIATSQRDNLEKLSLYLQQPETHSPYGPQLDLATLGAAWQFLRYLADRGSTPERTLWLNLVNTTSSGIPNIEAAAGIDFFTVLRDWAIAQYTDDAGFAVASAFQHPSWNFRSMLPRIRSDNAFPLTTYVLSSGDPLTLTLHPGGAGYVRFGVAGGRTGSVRVSGSGGSGAPSADVSLAIVRTK